MSIRSSLLMSSWFTLLWLHQLLPVKAKSFIMLYSTQFKCLKTISAEGSELYIKYELPDLQILQDDDNEDDDNDEKKEKQKSETNSKDSEYERRQEARLDKSAQYYKEEKSSIVLRIIEKEPYWEEEHHLSDPKKILLKKKSGEEIYRVKDDAQVEICFQSLTASGLNPVRVHIQVTDTPPKHIRIELRKQEVRSALSLLEDHIHDMTDEIQQILRDGDYLKDFESMVWIKNNKFFTATMMWPIARIAVLILVMGVLPGFYLTHFFKKIGY